MFHRKLFTYKASLLLQGIPPIVVSLSVRERERERAISPGLSERERERERESTRITRLISLSEKVNFLLISRDIGHS